ncbi:hypothetical protein MUP77_04100 [Candidatus Bathyarchaeota archaeon]|nr:hypothetical protein [Candidatus Bathyarchaeota archaeon]
MSRKKTGKSEYLNDTDTRDLMQRLDEFFESKVNIARATKWADRAHEKGETIKS